MKYTENDLQLGDKLLCTKSEVDHWISGKMYELKLNNLGVLEVKDEDGDEAYSSYLLECLNKEWDLVEFELIKEENMKKLKLGDKVICTRDARKRWWKKGKIYEVVKSKNTGKLVVLDEEEDEREIRIVEHYLNRDVMLNFELYKEENNMQEFKVGDLVEVVKNNSHAYKNKSDIYQVGDKAIVTGVSVLNVRIGDNKYGNLISKKEIKKVELTPELTEYDEELVLRLAKEIREKDNLLKEIETNREILDISIKALEKRQKEIKEITKKLLTK